MEVQERAQRTFYEELKLIIIIIIIVCRVEEKKYSEAAENGLIPNGILQRGPAEQLFPLETIRTYPIPFMPAQSSPVPSSSVQFNP